MQEKRNLNKHKVQNIITKVQNIITIMQNKHKVQLCRKKET